MKSLIEVTKIADELSFEDRSGLAAHLLAGFSSAPAGPDDAELERREAEIASGKVELLDHAAFIRTVVLSERTARFISPVLSGCRAK